MKLKIIAIISVVIVCTFAPFSIFASAITPEEIIPVEYSDYITNVAVDEDNDIITMDIPLTDCKIYSKQMIEGQWSGVTITQGNSVMISCDRVSSTQYNYEFYPLGDKYIKAIDIPDGTIITYTVVAYYSQPNPSGDKYGFSKAYAIARKKDNSVLNYNVGTSTKLSHGVSTQLQTTFNKPAGTEYLNPMYDLTYTPYMNGWFTVELVSCRMQFSIKSLTRLQQETGKTNKLLESLISGSQEDNNKAEEFDQEIQNKVEEADKVKEELEAVDKPNPEDIAVEVDTFKIVTQDNMTEYTNIFKSLLENNLVKSFLIIGVSIAMVSLVLFGKKG